MWDEIYGDDSGADPFGYPADIAPHAPTDPEIADLQYVPVLPFSFLFYLPNTVCVLFSRLTANAIH
jgi:hypothetical protein